MGLLGLNLLSTSLLPSRAKAPPAKTAGDYAWLSIPFSLLFQTSKMDMKPSSCVLPCPFRCWCLFTQYRTAACVLVVIRSNLEDTHLAEIINVLVMVHGSIHISLCPLHDWHFQVGIWKIAWSDTSSFCSTVHFLNSKSKAPRNISKKSLFKALISVASLENLIRVCCYLTLPWALNI